jgi:hypothetical protein
MLNEVASCSPVWRVLSMLAVVSVASQPCDGAYGRGASAADTVHRQKVVCVLADSSGRHVLTVAPACRN